MSARNTARVFQKTSRMPRPAHMALWLSEGGYTPRCRAEAESTRPFTPSRAKVERNLLMHGILGLGFFEDDFHHPLVFIDIVGVAKRLIVLGVDLDQNFSLGNPRNFRHALLRTLEFPGQPCFSQSKGFEGTPAHKFDDYRCAIHRLAAFVGHMDLEV